MKTSYLAIFLLAAIVAAGCSPTHELLQTVDPDGGAAVVFNKPYQVTFRAAVRVMQNHGEVIQEATTQKGRIISLNIFRVPRAIFLKRLTLGRTRVEISSSMTGINAITANFPRGAEGFFSALREQIIVFEKIDIQKQEAQRIRLLQRQGRRTNSATSAQRQRPPRRPRRYRR